MITPNTRPCLFELEPDFKDELKMAVVPWGWKGLSEFTYYRTYARTNPKTNRLETWAECVIRVSEGMFSVLKTHAKLAHIPWNDAKGKRHAREAAWRLFTFKWTPPGRGLWMMGTEFMWSRGSACLNNCAFVSTDNLKVDLSKPFRFLMDVSMLGVGVGFDTKGARQVKIAIPEGELDTYRVPDTREGWVEAIGRLIDSYMIPGRRPVGMDATDVRPYGAPIKGFGGTASGPGPLITGFNGIRDILENRARSGDPLITSVDIVDIQNLIGKIVVAGNVRRTAEIAFAEPTDKDFTGMKDWQKFSVETGSLAPLELKAISEDDYARYNADFKARGEIAKKYEHQPWAYKIGGWRWASNNSIFAEVGMDYTEVAKQTALSGEPGFAWLENMRRYGRMQDGINNKDHRVKGGNPCLEQSLESYELCCLVETFPSVHEDYWDYQRTLKFAYLYAKAVTLMATHWEDTNAVMLRNRRIGCSQSGILEAFAKWGRRRVLDEFCDKAYGYITKIDRKYSEWLAVRESIKTTSVKPSGTVSLLAGRLPGIHGAEAHAYYRTVRVANTSPLLPILRGAGYRIEPAVSDPLRTSVVYFPVIHEPGIPTKAEMTIWEQFKNAADYQRWWADNQVSITITFKGSEKGEIAKCLSAFDTELKGVSLLPISDHGYAQAPYTPAPQEEIEAYAATLKPLDFTRLGEEAEGENSGANLYCDGDKCALPGA